MGGAGTLLAEPEGKSELSPEIFRCSGKPWEHHMVNHGNSLKTMENHGKAI